MNTLKRGSNEPDVILLQRYLELEPDGCFGAKTENALKMFQDEYKLGSDGICGPKTWKVLQEEYDKPEAISEDDFKEAAEALGLDVAFVKAVAEVEAAGRGFESNRRPRILFEGHIFWSRLKKQGIDPEKFVSDHSGILYPKWDKSKYFGGEKEWLRLEEAWKINKKAALESASYGLFQIMGFNYASCGCKDVFEFVSEMFFSEGRQLNMFCKFCKSLGLEKYLKEKDWAGFARRYNGPEYAKNEYDKKLEAAYKKYKKKWYEF